MNNMYQSELIVFISISWFINSENNSFILIPITNMMLWKTHKENKNEMVYFLLVQKLQQY